MKRPVAVAVATIEAVKAVQATPIQEKKARRGITAAPFAAVAAGTAATCGSPRIAISPRFTIAMLINTIKMTTGSSMAAAVAIAVTTWGMFNLLRCLKQK
jgi:hypothetical protein